MPPTPSWLCATGSIIFGTKPPTSVPVVSVRYLPTVPLELARPFGNDADFEFSRRRDVSHALAARTTTRASTWCSLPSIELTYVTPLPLPERRGGVGVAPAPVDSIAAAPPARLAGGVEGDFPRHRVRHERELAGGARRRDQHVRRREVRVGLAAAVALPAEVALRPTVERLREDRQPGRHARHVEALGRLHDEQLVAPRFGRRQEDAVRGVRNVLVAAEDADQAFELLVVGFDVVVADRPIIAEAVKGVGLEVARAEAQRDATPVVGGAADHPRAQIGRA